MRVLLGVTGSVASTLTDKLIATLEAYDHEVKVVVTRPATYFWRKGRRAYGWSILRSKLSPFKHDPLKRTVLTDWDEWPGTRYHKDDLVLHIALRDWADVLVIAPLTANTLAKIANGVSDNLLTSVALAWDPKKPVIFAPAMNTKMWESPVTQANLLKMAEWHPKWLLAKPQSKKLACGDTGMGAMAKIESIVKAVEDTQCKVIPS